MKEKEQTLLALAAEILERDKFLMPVVVVGYSSTNQLGALFGFEPDSEKSYQKLLPKAIVDRLIKEGIDIKFDVVYMIADSSMTIVPENKQMDGIVLYKVTEDGKGVFAFLPYEKDEHDNIKYKPELGINYLGYDLEIERVGTIKATEEDDNPDNVDSWLFTVFHERDAILFQTPPEGPLH